MSAFKYELMGAHATRKTVVGDLVIYLIKHT